VRLHVRNTGPPIAQIGHQLAGAAKIAGPTLDWLVLAIRLRRTKILASGGTKIAGSTLESLLLALLRSAPGLASQVCGCGGGRSRTLLTTPAVRCFVVAVEASVVVPVIVVSHGEAHVPPAAWPVGVGCGRGREA